MCDHVRAVEGHLGIQSQSPVSEVTQHEPVMYTLSEAYIVLVKGCHINNKDTNIYHRRTKEIRQHTLTSTV